MFTFKTKLAGRIENDGTKDVEVKVPLIIFNFSGTLEEALIHCRINLILTWSANCFTIDVSVNKLVPTFTITDTKCYIPIVTLSIQDNPKAFATLQQLKSDFKRAINWNNKSNLTVQE